MRENRDNVRDVLVRGSSDLSALRERISIPTELRGRWAAARREVHAVVGFAPTPMEIVIWIPVRDTAAASDGPGWSTIGDVVGAEGESGTIALNIDAVRAVCPECIAGMPVEGAQVRVTGPRYPAAVFEGGGFADGRAVRVAGGLLVGLTSRSGP